MLTVAPIAALLAQAPAGAPAGPSSDPVAQNLNLRFANGIVAVAEEKIITVADVMQEIGPLIPQLRNSARNEKEFQEGLERLQDDAIQNLIDRVLIVKEFRKDEKRQIPQQYIENAISEELAERFEGDRSKFLAFLRSKGQTIRDYRREVEENIIFQYMQGQQRKSQSIISPVRIETYYNENKDRFYREPILKFERGEMVWRYLRDYIEEAAVKQNEPLSEETVAAMDRLDLVMDRAGLQFRYFLKPGETAVINDKQIFHGRTAFIDSPDAISLEERLAGNNNRPVKRTYSRIWVNR